MLTSKQRELIRLSFEYKYMLAYGGARSGKTWALIDLIVFTALNYPKSRHLICRRYAIDIRNSIYKITLQMILQSHDLHEGIDYVSNVQDMEVRFSNKSVIACSGLDDKERVDKVLGQEYVSIYINESQDVPWTTIRTLRTRLSQNIEGCKQKFYADLNPTSANHWTYKLWFEGVDPESGEGIDRVDYAKIKMSPYDNKTNLPADYIKSELESLVGNARRRFLDGDYTSTNDLTIFIPINYYDLHEFKTWGELNGWHRVKVIGGLDIGYNDADGFVILAYIDGLPQTFLLREYKSRRNTITELATNIKAIIEDIKTTYSMIDYSEFVIHGDSGGGGKKIISELSAMHDLPLTPAYKRDKKNGIELLQDEINTQGRLHIIRDSPFCFECRKIVWTRDRESGRIIREIDNEQYHPDLMDAILYPYRYLWSYGNTALRSKQSND